MAQAGGVSDLSHFMDRLLNEIVTPLPRPPHIDGQHNNIENPDDSLKTNVFVEKKNDPCCKKKLNF